MAFAARIGKVRMKATGFEFRVIPGTPEPKTDTGSTLLANAKAFAAEPELTGYLIVGLYAPGTFGTAFRWPDDSPIPATLAPSYMAEIVRREMIVCPEAADEFDRRFEWVE